MEKRIKCQYLTMKFSALPVGMQVITWNASVCLRVCVFWRILQVHLSVFAVILRLISSFLANIIFIACVYPGRCNNVLIFVQVELVCRVATLLLQVHHHQLITTPSARPVLTVLKDILYARVKVIIAISLYNANRVLLGER